MHEKVLESVHRIRNLVAALQGIIHMKMPGDDRFRAENVLHDISTENEKIWVGCLQCTDASGGQDDSQQGPSNKDRHAAVSPPDVPAQPPKKLE